MVARLPATGRAVLLLLIASVVALAATLTIAAIWLDYGSNDLPSLALWLTVAAACALAIGTFLAWVVDRAADGSYATRLAISGILTTLVFAVTAWIAIWQTYDSGQSRTLLWLLFGYAMAISAIFALFAAWLDARPVGSTAGAAMAIASGSFSSRLPETGNTEIAEIATSVNLLASRAQASALRQSNQDRVRESLLLAIAADAQVPIDNVRSIVLSMGASGNIDPVVSQRHLDALSREIGQLQRRVDEIEEIARLESGQITLRLQPVSLAQLAVAACDKMQPRAATRNVLISPNVDFSAPRVLVDPVQTGRALESLMAYALSETPDGSLLSVEMNLSGQFVQLALLEAPGVVELDTAARIRWDSAHRHRESALSLAVAGRIIEIQGGSFLVSRGSATAPLVVLSLPRS